MGKSLESAQHEFSTVRTGRASPALLDRVIVDYYGATTPLNQLATISAPEARLLTVQPYDKSSIKAIEKAINESDVGLNPSNDGNVVRLVGPRAHRRAPQGARQGRARPRRGGTRRDPQRPPRRDARAARAEGRGRSVLRRRAPRGGRAAEAHRRAHRRPRRGSSRPRKRRSSRSDGRRRAAATALARGRRHAGRARYVAIITDGNGRWARAHGLPVNDGHSAGADTVKARLRDAVELGIEELTVYSFSTENWSRPRAEVRGLMAMFCQRIARETPELHAEGVRMRFIGRREGVDARLVEQMRWAEELTAANTRITLFVAFNYGGRAEILDAAARLHRRSSEEEFRACLYAPEMHDPDLIIRTSGEQRLSNYLLWQSAVLRARLSRRAVAGLHARGARGVPRRVRSAPQALRWKVRGADGQRPALSRADRRGCACAACARTREADRALAFAAARRRLGSRREGPGVDAGDRVRAVHRDRRRGRVRVRRARCSAARACMSSTGCTSARARCAWRDC